MAGLPLGTAVTVTAYNDTWYKRVAGGYLSRQYAKPADTTPQPTPIVVYVDTRDGLNVRSGPGTNYPIITTLKDGDAVIVTEYVEIARAFFEDEEPKLVNAVLDRIAKQVRGPAKK